MGEYHHGTPGEVDKQLAKVNDELIEKQSLLKDVRQRLMRAAVISRELTDAAEVSHLNKEELLERVIHHFGGIDGFAKDLHAEFIAAPQGGMARQRILEMIGRLFVAQPENVPLAEMSTEDIEAVLRSAISDE